MVRDHLAPLLANVFAKTTTSEELMQSVSKSLENDQLRPVENLERHGKCCQISNLIEVGDKHHHHLSLLSLIFILN